MKNKLKPRVVGAERELDRIKKDILFVERQSNDEIKFKKALIKVEKRSIKLITDLRVINEEIVVEANKLFKEGVLKASFAMLFGLSLALIVGVSFISTDDIIRTSPLLLGVLSGVLGGGFILVFVSVKDLFHLILTMKKMGLFTVGTNIIYPPGSSLIKIISFLFAKKTVDRIFESIIADMNVEYFDALDNGFEWKARWIHFRGVLTVFSKAITLLPMSLLDALIKINKIG